MSDQTFSASATVRVRGFDSPRHASTVAALLGDTLGNALAAAVRDALPESSAQQPASGELLDVR
jgi:hypothetical protein